MKKEEIKIGENYIAKISGKLTDVRIQGVSSYGGWDAMNLTTRRMVRIHTGAKLRGVSKPKRCGTCANCQTIATQRADFQDRLNTAKADQSVSEESRKINAESIKLAWRVIVDTHPCQAGVD